jgi:hypothetical protein
MLLGLPLDALHITLPNIKAEDQPMDFATAK